MRLCLSLLTLLINYKIFCCAESNQCPDGKTSCPVSSTCCHLSNGSFGCCPIQNAVCCEDSLHCCPGGYKCDVTKGVCTMGAENVPLLKKIPATTTTNEAYSVAAIICPGGEGQCPADHSCCSIPGSNQFHCCPSGYSCDNGICQQTKLEFPAAILTTSTDKVVKCNQKFACPDRYTCCEDGEHYHCCPLPEAVCCSDNIHCCPRGFECSPDNKRCSSGSRSILALSTALPKTVSKGLSRFLQQILKTVSKEWISRTVQKRRQSVVMKEKVLENFVCPDGVSECPDGNTCCKLASGQYGCCPLPKAVCCSDGVHCCPNGYTCDTSAGTCNKGSVTAPMLQKMLSSKSIVKANNIVCPDGVSECPDGNTCCRLSSGQYGCCPLPDAVCCSDGVHCCPNGYTCDTSAGTCNKGIITVLMLETTSALIKTAKVDTAHEDVDTVFCPDGESECPNGYTCCKDTSGQYGCCPKGFTCNSNGTCHKGSERPVQSIMVPTKSSVDPVANSSVSVLCPDKKYQCPGGSTCCKLHSGSYGCCPIEKAVCCSDDKHCCPQGYTCDLKEGKCDRQGEQVSMVASIPAIGTKSADGLVNYVECPDGSECFNDETCCEMSDGRYGCCPMPDAVCCEDGEHCCPCGYRCDMASQSCVTGSVHIPMLNKSLRLHKPRKVTMDEKIRFTPGQPQGENPVEHVDQL